VNILIVGPEIAERSRIKDFGGVWSYYLSRELRNRGIGVRFVPASQRDPAFWATVDLDGIDHVIGLSRYFSKAPPECAWIVAERIPGLVCQIHDRKRPGDPVDTTFAICAGKGVGLKNNIVVGWAADHELCAPRQGDELGILIDHPNYGEGPRVDYSLQVAQQVAEFVKAESWRPAWPGVSLRRLVDGGVETMDFARLKPRPFTRKHVPFERIAAEYGRAHLFMVTHPESLGLTVLETALAGALVVAPAGYIADDLLATVRHLTYERDVPWGAVLKMIDPAASRNVALGNSWARVTSRILTHIEDFESKGLA
jgi:hypothetical protein